MEFWLTILLSFGILAGSGQAKKDCKNLQLDSELDDLWRFEDIAHKDHRHIVGDEINYEANFSFYRYDGLIGAVVTPAAFSRTLCEKKAAQKLVPIYETFDEKNVHHFLTLNKSETTDYGDSLPIAYCSLTKGYLGATEPLHYYKGEPIDQLGNRGYDSFYTTNEVEAELPDKISYAYMGVLCYIWKRPASREESDVLKEGQNVLRKHLHKHLVPIYHFFNKLIHDHYWDTDIKKPDEFLNTMMYIIKPESVNIFMKACPDLAPMNEYKYNYNSETPAFVHHELAISNETYKKHLNDKGTLQEYTLLGFTSPRRNYCGARQLISELVHMPNDGGAIHELVDDYDVDTFTEAHKPTDYSSQENWVGFDFFVW